MLQPNSDVPSFGRVNMEVILCEVEQNHFQFAIHSGFFSFFFYKMERNSEEKAASSDTAPPFSRSSGLGVKRGEGKRDVPPSEPRRKNLICLEIICNGFNPSRRRVLK